MFSHSPLTEFTAALTRFQVALKVSPGHLQEVGTLVDKFGPKSEQLYQPVYFIGRSCSIRYTFKTFIDCKSSVRCPQKISSSLEFCKLKNTDFGVAVTRPKMMKISQNFDIFVVFNNAQYRHIQCNRRKNQSFY